jgi:broad specificity phosphatase PhoE
MKSNNKKSSGPKSTLIIMVRHGKTPSTGKLLPGRAAGLHLSDTGKQEALDVAGRLSKLKNVSAIYASPLERARETAAPTAKLLNQKVLINKGLLECDFGDWTGKELSKLMKLAEWSTSKW